MIAFPFSPAWALNILNFLHIKILKHTNSLKAFLRASHLCKSSLRSFVAPEPNWGTSPHSAFSLSVFVPLLVLFTCCKVTFHASTTSVSFFYRFPNRVRIVFGCTEVLFLKCSVLSCLYFWSNPSAVLCFKCPTVLSCSVK